MYLPKKIYKKVLSLKDTVEINSALTLVDRDNLAIKILSVDKTKPQYGGHDYLRGAENNSFLKNIIFLLIGIVVCIILGS